MFIYFVLLPYACHNTELAIDSELRSYVRVEVLMVSVDGKQHQKKNEKVIDCGKGCITRS